MHLQRQGEINAVAAPSTRPGERWIGKSTAVAAERA